MKMTKKIEDRVFRQLRIMKNMQQEDYKKGFYFQTHQKHEAGITGYLQGLLDCGFTEEQINPMINRANEVMKELYGKNIKLV